MTAITLRMGRAARPGLTLIELLVVIAIVATLVGLTLSGVQRVRSAAARATCANNLRQLGLAAQQYHADRGRLPSGNFAFYELISWQGPLLPYLEQDALWQTTKAQYEAGVTFADEGFVAGHTVVKVLTCPSDAATQSPQIRGGVSFVEGNYLGNYGVSNSRNTIGAGPDLPPEGVLFKQSRIRFADITDGTSNTLLAGERPKIEGSGGGWYLHSSHGTAFLGAEEDVMGDDFDRKRCPSPIVFGPGRRTNRCDFLHFWSLHDAGANFVLCDGSVRLIPYSARAILPALATRAAGDTVFSPD